MTDLPPEKSQKRERFSSHSSRTSIWRLWVRARLRGGRTRVKIYWKRILVVLGLLAVAGWMSLALAAYLFLKQKHDFKDISYLNLVLPHRWPEHRRALGRHYIAKAKQALSDRNIADAYHFFSAGVSRAPEDIEARRLFAAINSRIGRSAVAAKLLIAGFPHGYTDVEYVRQTFAVLFEQQREEEALQLIAQHLPANPTKVAADQFLAQQAATANFRLGRYDEAEKILRHWQLDQQVEGVLLLARCEWERGYPDLALLRLEGARDRFPGSDPLALQLLRFYRELGNHPRALQEAVMRVSGDPLSPGPRIDLLHSLHIVGDTAQFKRETQAYLREFARDPVALLLLARVSADLGEVELTREARRQVSGLEVNQTAFAMLEVESLISADRFKEASQLAESLQAENPPQSGPGRTLLGWRAVAAFAEGDATKGDVLLQAFTSESGLRGSEAMPMVTTLERAGAYPAARRLLATLVQQQPLHQSALTRLVRLDAAQGNLEGLDEYVPRLLTFSKPSRAVLQEAFSALNDATPTRAALRRTVGETISRLTANPEPGS